jgi:autotransporter-associated beta strand protein
MNGTTDIATFNAAIANSWGSSGSPIVIDMAGQSIGGINFNTASDNYFIGGTGSNFPLYLTSGGTIQILSTLTSTNAVENINAPLLLAGAAYTFANNSASGIGAGAGTLDFGGTISGNSGVSTVLTLSSSSNNTNANTLSGIISNGSASPLGITVTGGSWTLSNNGNTYTGLTTVNGGTLISTQANSLGSGTSGGGLVMSPSSGTATVDFQSSVPAIASLTSSGAGASSILLGGTGGTATTLTVGGNNASTAYAGTFLDANTTLGDKGALTKTGTGTLTLTGAGSSISNALTISSGLVSINGGSLSVGSGSTAASTGSTLQAQLIVNGGNFTSGGTFTVGSTGNTTSGILVEAGTANFATITEDNAGSNSVHPYVIVSGGTLNATTLTEGRNTGSTQTFGSGIIVSGTGILDVTGTITANSQNSGGSASVQGGSVTAGTFVVDAPNTSDTRTGALQVTSGSLTVTSTTGGLVVVNTNFGDVGTVTLSGGTTTLGQLTMGGSNTISTGSATVTESGSSTSLYIGSGGIVNNALAGMTSTINLNGGILGATANWSSSVPMVLSNTTPTTIQAADSSTNPWNITLSGILSGSTAALTKTGGGTLALSAADTYGGVTTINAGTLSTGTGGSLPNGGLPSSVGESSAVAANLVLNGGTLQYASTSGTAASTNRLFTLGLNGGGLDASGTSPITFAGPGTIAFSGTGTRTFTLTGSNTGANTFVPILNNDASNNATSLTKSGAGSWIDSASNGFTGAVIVSAGNLTLSGTNVYTANTTINGGKLTMGSGTAISNTAITVNSTGTFAATPGTGTYTVGSNAASLTLNAGSTFSLQDGSVGILNINAAAVGAGTVLTLGGTNANPSNLKFDVGGGASGADQLIANDGTVSFTGTVNDITLNPLGSTPPSTTSNIPLLTVPNGTLVLADFSVQTAPLLFGASAFAANLTLGAGNHSLLLTLTPVTLNYYWVGGAGPSWAAGNNFATTQSGGSLWSNAPGSGANVFLTATSASNFSQTLNASYSINSLSFTGTGTSAAGNSITLANGTGTNTLTLTAGGGFVDQNSNIYAAGIGLVVQAGSAAHTISDNVALGGSQTWEIDNSAANALTVSGNVGDGGNNFGLTKTGVGGLKLGGTNTYGGLTTVTNGVVTASNNSSLGSSTTAASGLLMNPASNTATVDFTSASPAIGSLASSGAGTSSIVLGNAAGPSATILTVGGSNTSTVYAGSISNASGSAIGYLTKTGSGTLTLNGAGTFTGGTTISAGVLAIGSDGAIDNGAGGITFNGGTLQFNNYASTNLPTAAFNNNASLSLGAATGTASSLDTAPLGVGTALITGSSVLTYIGPGTLQLLGQNNYTGVTNINGGELNAGFADTGTSGPFGNGGNISFGGGALQYSAANQYDYSSRIIGSTGPIAIDTNGQNVTFNTTLASSNVGGLTKLGAGSLTLANSDSYTGITTVSAGTLNVNNDAALGSSTAATAGLLLNPAASVTATVNFTSTNPAAGYLASSGAGTSQIVLGNSTTGSPTTLTIGGSSLPANYAGSISDGAGINPGAVGTLIKYGLGNQTLGGASTYTGTTSVNGGVLTVSATGTIGSMATPGGAMNVGVAGTASGNTIGGSATVGGATANLTVNGGTVTVTSLTLNNEGGTNLSLTSGALNVTGNLGVNDDGNNNNSIASVTGGTLNANSVTIHRSNLNEGNGAPLLTGFTTAGLLVGGAGNPTVNIATTLNFDTTGGSASASSANMQITSGSVTVGGTTIITINNGSRMSILDIDGGSFTSNDTTGAGVQLGGDVGSSNNGELLVQAGTATVNTITLGDSNQTSGDDDLELIGGTTYVGSGGIVNNSAGATIFANLGSSTVATFPTLGATGNWSSSVPLALSDGSSGTAAEAPTIQTSDSMGTPHNITLSGALSSLQDLNVTGTGSLTLTAASPGFAANLYLNGGTLNVSDTASLLLVSLTTQPGTTANLTGILTYSGVNVTDGGTLVLGAADANNNPGGSYLPQTWNSLTINSGASLAFLPAATTATRTVLQVNSLSNSGKIDLSSNDLIIHSGGSGESVFGPLSTPGTIENQVATGRGTNGHWGGTTGITSSAAAASPTNMALAVVINDTNQSGSGSLTGTQLVQSGSPFNNGLTTFDGQSVNDGDVLVKYTYYGDALLTGSVTALDYAQIDNAYNVDKTTPGALTGWYNGDFNYDGVINGDDYTLIDNAFNSQDGVSFAGVSAGPANMIAGDTEQIAGSDVVATPAVPEPATLSLLGMAAVGMLGRRRRRTK